MAENEIKSINGKKLHDEKARQDIVNLQPKTDEELSTVSKEIIGAINELKSSFDTSDFSNLTLTTENVTDGIKLIMTNKTISKSIIIPSANVTNEQIESVIQAKIDNMNNNILNLTVDKILSNNIYNTNLSTNGYYQFTKDDFVQDSNMAFIGKIPVEQGKYYTISEHNTGLSRNLFSGQIAFYKDNNCIKFNNLVSLPFTFLAEDSFDSFGFNIDLRGELNFEDALNMIMINEGTEVKDFDLYNKSTVIADKKYELYNDIINLKNKQSYIDDLMVVTSSTSNLYDYTKNKYGCGYFLDMYENPGLILTGNIPVVENMTYCISFIDKENLYTNKSIYSIAYFKDNDLIDKKMIQIELNNFKAIVIPPSVNNIKLTISLGNESDYNSIYEPISKLLKVELGANPTEIEDFNPVRKITLDSYEGKDLFLERSKGRWENKKIITFGDSITQGMEYGSYVPYMNPILKTNIDNRGISGYDSKSLVNVITDTSRYSEKSNDIESIDYTKVDAVTIQIGINSFSAGTLDSLPYRNNLTQTIDKLPFEYNGKTIDTEQKYWAEFPDNYFGHLAICIEWIQWKNPETKIYLITEPPIGDTTTTDYMWTIRDYLFELGEEYNIPVINALDNAGLSKRNYYRFSYDTCHFNDLGNKLWGEYIAYYMLSH